MNKREIEMRGRVNKERMHRVRDDWSRPASSGFRWTLPPASL